MFWQWEKQAHQANVKLFGGTLQDETNNSCVSRSFTSWWRNAEDWRLNSATASPADIHLRTELRRWGKSTKCSRRVWRTTAGGALAELLYRITFILLLGASNTSDWLELKRSVEQRINLLWLKHGPAAPPGGKSR